MVLGVQIVQLIHVLIWWIIVRKYINTIYHTTSDTLLREALFIFSSCFPSSHLESSLDVASRWAPKMPLATYRETSRTDPRVTPLSSLRWLTGKPPISIGNTSSNGGCFILMFVWLVWLGGCTSCFKFFPIDFLKAPPHHHHVGSLRKNMFSAVWFGWSPENSQWVWVQCLNDVCFEDGNLRFPSNELLLRSLTKLKPYHFVITWRFSPLFWDTLPKTNIAPENIPLEKEIPIGNQHFQVLN